jgi:hypothetical protein
MARLVVQPGSPAAWEIQLKAGTNSLGRATANDFALSDPSVSGTHCQVVVEQGKAVIIDLGSTNGTYVNRARVRQAALQSGQTIHLGGLEMMFYSDVPAQTGTAPPAAPPRAVPGAPPLPPPRAVGPMRVTRVGTATTVALDAPPVALSATPQAPLAAPPFVAPPLPSIGSGPCKHHPRIAGRYFCSHCQLYFCDACVTTRGQQKFCRHCGTECMPVQVQIQPLAIPKSFFARFPGAFIYPFRGSGPLVLIVSTLVLAAMEFISAGLFSVLTKIVAFGYLFSFMQNIIHATANEEEQMPELPGLDDVFGGAFRLLVTVLMSFALPVAFAALKMFDVMDVPASAVIATMVLGCLYFPMAFLAVAMKDTALAANPLVVVPAICRVPVAYLVTTLVVIGLFTLRRFGDIAAFVAQGTSYSTRDMSTLFLSFAVRALWCLVSVYLLTVSMRTLGLLYVTNKSKFGWFSH